MPTLTIELLNPKAKTILDGLADIGLIAVNANGCDAPMEELDDDDEFSDEEDFFEPQNIVPQLGCLKGKIWMADDFDAPMEEFAEYM